MTYKLDGYFRDKGGTVGCIYGYDRHGHKVMIYKGYFNYKCDTVTLYPHARLAPTSETVAKVTIPIRCLHR